MSEPPTSTAEREPPAPDRELVRALQATRKYRRVHPGLLARVAGRTVAGRTVAGRSPAGRGRREALKAAKRALHQVAGAFLDADACRRAERLARSMADAGAADRRRLCRAVLRLHASSAERLPVMEALYERVWQEAADARGAPRSASVRVLDVACGLSPFALPWMRLAPGSAYRGIDGDGRVVDLARIALPYLEAPALRAAPVVDTADVLEPTAAPAGRYDVVLMLKTLPTLERLAPGAGVDLVRRTAEPVVVISTATGSLGGGRRLRHDDLIEQALAAGGRRPAARFEMAGESVVVAR